MLSVSGDANMSSQEWVLLYATETSESFTGSSIPVNHDEALRASHVGIDEQFQIKNSFHGFLISSCSGAGCGHQRSREAMPATKTASRTIRITASSSFMGGDTRVAPRPFPVNR